MPNDVITVIESAAHGDNSPFDNSPRGKQKSRAIWLRLGIVGAYFYLLQVPFTDVFLPSYLPRRLNLREATSGVLGAGVLLEIFAFAVLYLLLKRSGRSLLTLGWGQTPHHQTVRNGLLVAGGMTCLVAVFIPTLRVYGIEISQFKVFGIAAAFVTAVIEEVFFRGFLIQQLNKLQVPVRRQIWISGLAHGLFRGLAFWWGLPIFCILSLYWAWLYKKGQESLTPCIYSHLLFNLLTEPWITLNLVHQVTRFYP